MLVQTIDLLSRYKVTLRILNIVDNNFLTYLYQSN